MHATIAREGGKLESVSVAAAPGDIEWVSFGPQHVIPRRFQARVRDRRYPFCEFEVEVRDGKPTCVWLQVETTDTVPTITWSNIRLPLRMFVEEATAVAAMRLVTGPDGRVTGHPSYLHSDEEFEAFYEAASTRLPRRGVPLDDEHLRKVAEVYRDPRGGRHPTEFVAEQLHATRPTAGRWVMKAREKGFLGKARDRQAGEI